MQTFRWVYESLLQPVPLNRSEKVMPLEEELARCELDTRDVIGVGAATRLAAWRQYERQEDLIEFIRRMIRNQQNRANGFLLSQQNRVSLESIVINNRNSFSDDDLRIARATLGL